MPSWTSFYLRLKQVLKLFSHRGHHRQFVTCCVEGTQYSGLKGQLDIFIPKVLESRWSTVVKALESLLPLEWALCRVWSEQRFKQGSPGEDGHAANVAQPLQPGDNEGDDEHKIDASIISKCIRHSNNRASICGSYEI